MRISTPKVGARLAVETELRKATLLRGQLRQNLPGSEFRTAAGPMAKPSIVRISPADILTIDGQIRKTFHILIPRWRLTALATAAIESGLERITDEAVLAWTPLINSEAAFV
jgi:hypothetical protein